MTTTYERINITIPPDIKDKLQVLSKAHLRNPSNMISFLIQQAYEDLPEEKKKRIRGQLGIAILGLHASLSFRRKEGIKI